MRRFLATGLLLLQVPTLARGLPSTPRDGAAAAFGHAGVVSPAATAHASPVEDEASHAADLPYSPEPHAVHNGGRLRQNVLGGGGSSNDAAAALPRPAASSDTEQKLAKIEAHLAEVAAIEIEIRTRSERLGPASPRPTPLTREYVRERDERDYIHFLNVKRKSLLTIVDILTEQLAASTLTTTTTTATISTSTTVATPFSTTSTIWTSTTTTTTTTTKTTPEQPADQHPPSLLDCPTPSCVLHHLLSKSRAALGAFLSATDTESNPHHHHQAPPAPDDSDSGSGSDGHGDSDGDGDGGEGLDLDRDLLENDLDALDRFCLFMLLAAPVLAVLGSLLGKAGERRRRGFVGEGWSGEEEEEEAGWELPLPVTDGRGRGLPGGGGWRGWGCLGRGEVLQREEPGEVLTRGEGEEEEEEEWDEKRESMDEKVGEVEVVEVVAVEEEEVVVAGEEEEGYESDEELMALGEEIAAFRSAFDLVEGMVAAGEGREARRGE